MNKSNCPKSLEAGFSLIELMVVLMIIGLVAAIVIGAKFLRSNEVGGAERVLTQVEQKINERKSDAIRLNGSSLNTGFAEFLVDPVEINFAEAASTASLRVNTDDANRDCADDYTNEPLTCLKLDGAGRAYWQYAYEHNPLDLPGSWQLAESPEELGGLPLIANGTNGRGNLAVAIGFDRVGHAYAIEITGASVPSDWKSFPINSPSAIKNIPDRESAPFWALYFVPKSQTAAKQQSPALSDLSAVALAVHPASGTVERFRWDGEKWIGHDNRAFSVK